MLRGSAAAGSCVPATTSLGGDRLAAGRLAVDDTSIGERSTLSPATASRPSPRRPLPPERRRLGPGPRHPFRVGRHEPGLCQMDPKHPRRGHASSGRGSGRRSPLAGEGLVHAPRRSSLDLPISAKQDNALTGDIAELNEQEAITAGPSIRSIRRRDAVDPDTVNEGGQRVPGSFGGQVALRFQTRWAVQPHPGGPIWL